MISLLAAMLLQAANPPNAESDRQISVDRASLQALAEQVDTAQKRFNAAAVKCDLGRMQAATSELERLSQEARLALDQARSAGPSDSETVKLAESAYAFARATLHFHSGPPANCR